MTDPTTMWRAFNLYKAFICGGYPRQQLRDEDGDPVFDLAGRPVFETLDEAALRRWERLPERTRQGFIAEAAAERKAS